MKKKSSKKHKKFYILIFAIILIICLLTTFIILKNFSKDYYAIQPRADKVSANVIESYEDYETIGWIQIQGTTIDLPVVYNSEKKYPVEIEGYAKMEKYLPGFHNYLEVSAHNIFNLSSTPRIEAEEFTRFEELMSFVYYDFAKENEYIQLTYENKEYVYKIFMVGFIPMTEKISYSEADYDENQMETYLKRIEEYNLYDYDIDVSTDDKIISLSTCTRFFANNSDWNFYVVGRLIRENEKIRSYSVSKSNNYNKIEEILKGDELNDKV